MKLIFSLVIFAAVTLSAFAQYAPLGYQIAGGRSALDQGTPEPRLVSNVIIDIRPEALDTLWLATGNGLSRVIVNRADLRGSHFDSYTQSNGLGKGGTSGLLVTDSILWASFAFDTSVGISGAGDGLVYSRDHGQTWVHFPQPRDPNYHHFDASGYDSTLGYWPTTTNVDNITYDIAQSDSFVWIASKGGGLRRHAYAADYTHYNDTTGWRVVSPLVLDDGRSLPFHPGDPVDGLIHRDFAVMYGDSAVWVGTAAGILKSTNEGRTWHNFRASRTSFSGNFVTALDYQESQHAVWAATWRAESSDEYYAVTKSTDGGATWHVYLDSAQVVQSIGRFETVRAHGFGFSPTGDTVYVCDDLGLWKSPDGGAHWALFANISDAANSHQFGEAQIYAAYSDSLYSVWAGGTDGLAVTSDRGNHWTLFQAAYPLSGGARSVDTYAYPNPWSPSRFGPVKLRYTAATGGAVKISIYDMAMSKVVDLPTATRPSGEQYETWDGRKNGTIVANGTYFYKISKPGGDVWGKVIVLD
ncbi:MAG TPA: hypothetical protein VGL38_06825 [bacterium]|jgi:hypothetical protein